MARGFAKRHAIPWCQRGPKGPGLQVAEVSHWIASEVDETPLDQNGGGTMEALKAEQELDLIGSRLSILAKGMGLTQEEIANRLKISRITINRFFKGRTEIRSGDLNQLLQLFGIEVGALLDEKIERLVKGKNLHVLPSHNEVSRALEELDPQVTKTIVDQINWWRSASQRPLNEHGVEI